MVHLGLAKRGVENLTMRYSFVVPIYKDADLARDFCVEFERVFRAYTGSEDLKQIVELIFVNDGSPDDASATLERVAREFEFVKLVELSRNFGQHIALSAGYRHAIGDYVGMLNVDMEDPPDQIPALLDVIQAGEAALVYGLRGKRPTPWLNRLTSYAFNWILVKLTGYDTPLNTATLRVMNRQFIDEYNRLTEKSRYIPGLEMWLGFEKACVPIQHRPRTRGTSAYTFFSRLRMAFETVISFSDLPLRTMVFAGTCLATLGFLLTVALVAGRFLFSEYRPGYTSTVSLILLLGGVQIVALGLASLYIGRILREVQNRPLYVVRRRFRCSEGDGDAQHRAR